MCIEAVTVYVPHCDDCRCRLDAALDEPAFSEQSAEQRALLAGWQRDGSDLLCPACHKRKLTLVTCRCCGEQDGELNADRAGWVIGDDVDYALCYQCVESRRTARWEGQR